MQGSTIPVQRSGPGAPAGAANLLASLPDEHYNTLALAVFFKLEGSQYLGHMITESSVNPITFLPIRHAQVQLTWPEERVVNVGARVGGLSPSIGGVFAEEGEAMILTAMGHPFIRERSRPAGIMNNGVKGTPMPSAWCINWAIGRAWAK
ncbi:hypothetical protein AB0911_37410 [Streptomyces nigra]|uniref:hypothetical protein n=1 Tax=Streptomyces nigra TaxID=1827580 RepID=UPI003454BA2A